MFAEQSGIVCEVDNRRLAKVAKLSGAPHNPGAGVLYSAPLGKNIKKGALLFTIYAESKGELAYALQYLKAQDNIIKIEPS